MKKLFSILLALLLFSALALPALAAADPAYPGEVLRLVNEERRKEGLPALRAGGAGLQAAVQLRAAEIVTLFDHTRPDGRDCFSVLDDYNVAHGWAGENIAAGQSSPADVVRAWMGSTPHRANILSRNFTTLGSAVYESGGRLYWAQLFISEDAEGGGGGGVIVVPPAPHFWDAWPPALQWLLRYVLFGWLWMRWV